MDASEKASACADPVGGGGVKLACSDLRRNIRPHGRGRFDQRGVRERGLKLSHCQ